MTLIFVASEGLADAERVIEEPAFTLDAPDMEIEVTGTFETGIRDVLISLAPYFQFMVRAWLPMVPLNVVLWLESIETETPP